MAEKSAVVEITPEEQIELCSARGSGLANAATLVSAQMPVMTEVLETGEFPVSSAGNLRVGHARHPVFCTGRLGIAGDRPRTRQPVNCDKNRMLTLSDGCFGRAPEMPNLVSFGFAYLQNYLQSLVLTPVGGRSIIAGRG